MAGKLDNSTVPLEDYATDSKRSDFYHYLSLAINYYTMNYNQKPFDNIDIRQAFELAVNKQEIVSKIWDGTFIATNHIVPQGQPGYDPTLKGVDGTTNLTGNPTLAKQLLQEGLKQEGWTSVKQMPQINLTYSSAGNQATKNEVAVMLQDWHDVLGITVNSDDIDINLLFKDERMGIQNPLQFFTGPGWATDYPDPEDWTTLLFTQSSSMNYGQNHSTDSVIQQATQKLLEQADVEQNPSIRMADDNKAEQQLVDDVAWFPMEQQYAFGLRKPCVQVVVNGPFGTPPDAWHNIYISDATCANATVS